ncbi:MAG: LarC family nickel insertion protein [Alphaproteobacteria bacterium]
MTEQGGATVVAVHLDAIGGVAGDMFAAALLDARPDLWPGCQRAIAAMALPAGVQASAVSHSDGVLTGSRFLVEGVAKAGEAQDHHVHWREIRGRLEAAELDAVVRESALGIFRLLAEAEAAVHGKAVEAVAFHEVGAYDSIVDIVSAAAIIAGLGPCRWSIGPVPRGRGTIRTAHGVLPVPAPATLELLQGFTLLDDGEDGERVTPTGAAILRYLAPSQSPDLVPRRLLGAGIGFGTRQLAARSNILRATLYGSTAGALLADRVTVLRCEIDDQTAEDLAVAIDRLRAIEGVLDICQWAVLAKKGRLATALQVLTRPDAADRVVAAMLDETTTLGVRRGEQPRSVVRREMRDAGGVRVKLAHLPHGVTAKAEIDDLAELGGASTRGARRAEAEEQAVREKDANGR